MKNGLDGGAGKTEKSVGTGVIGGWGGSSAHALSGFQFTHTCATRPGSHTHAHSGSPTHAQPGARACLHRGSRGFWYTTPRINRVEGFWGVLGHRVEGVLGPALNVGSRGSACQIINMSTF